MVAYYCSKLQGTESGPGPPMTLLLNVHSNMDVEDCVSRPQPASHLIGLDECLTSQSRV